MIQKNIEVLDEIIEYAQIIDIILNKIDKTPLGNAINEIKNTKNIQLIQFIRSDDDDSLDTPRRIIYFDRSNIRSLFECGESFLNYWKGEYYDFGRFIKKIFKKHQIICPEEISFENEICEYHLAWSVFYQINFEIMDIFTINELIYIFYFLNAYDEYFMDERDILYLSLINEYLGTFKNDNEQKNLEIFFNQSEEELFKIIMDFANTKSVNYEMLSKFALLEHKSKDIHEIFYNMHFFLDRNYLKNRFTNNI